MGGITVRDGGRAPGCEHTCTRAKVQGTVLWSLQCISHHISKASATNQLPVTYYSRSSPSWVPRWAPNAQPTATVARLTQHT